MKPLYICDFFVRNKEAVSNQIELLATNTGGKVVAATRFMDQKALRPSDIKANIYLLPPFLYQIALPILLIGRRRPVHYFEEEPSRTKQVLFNLRRGPLYISMYRRPTKEYSEHLKKYRKLRKVFVELEEHRDILLKDRIAADLVEVSRTPAKIARQEARKPYNPEKLSIVFASWNNKEKNALFERGLLYLLDTLVATPQATLTIPLRDNKTADFWQEAAKRGVQDRIVLRIISSIEELIAIYDEADFVAFTAQARVTKDVPNSLLDGLSRGKPLLVSTAVDFHSVVTTFRLGVVVPVGQEAGALRISKQDYRLLSKNAYRYAGNHTAQNYLKICRHYKV